MTSKDIKSKVKQFKEKYDLKRCDYDSIAAVTEKQGYTIVEFNHIDNDEDVATLIDALDLGSYISCSKGFTYADANYRIVFVHEDLSDEEKTRILAHENGHIYLGHFSSSQVIGRDVQEECDANEFSHYLHKDGFGLRLRRSFSKHKAIYIAAIILILASIAAFTTVSIIRENKYCDYYITRTGTKYHAEDCYFVKGKEDAQRMTTEQLESGEYEPCARCIKK